MLTTWFLILYSINKRTCLLLSSNGVHFSCSSISVTDDLFLYRFVTNMADLFYIISNLYYIFVGVDAIERWHTQLLV